VKVADTNHESRGHKSSRHVEMYPWQTCLCCSNGI